MTSNSAHRSMKRYRPSRIASKPFWKLLLGAFVLFTLGVAPASAQLAQGKSKFLGNIAKSSANDSQFSQYWNQVTPENSGKWGVVEATRDVMNWTNLDNAYNFAKANGFPFKFHAFVWGQQQPAWITSLSAAEQREEVEEWIRLVCERYPDIDLIDVVNEPVNTPAGYRGALGGAGTTGYDWIVWTFEKVRQYAPNAKLLINEYDIEKSSSDMTAYINIVTILKNRGLIDGVGLQAHFLESTPMTTIQSNIDRLAALGVPLYVSELDLSIANDAAQSAKYQELFPFFWEHPLVRGVTLWGYKQGGMWRVDGFLLRSDGSERPALVWLRDYVARTGEGPGIPLPAVAASATATSPWSISVTWSDQSSNETGFEIQVRSGSGLYQTALTSPANSTSANLTSLSPNTFYSIRIRSRNGTNQSWWSSVLTAQTQPAEPGRVNLGVLGSVIGFSAQESANPASNVIDGVTTNDNDRWSASGYPQWVIVDLGQDYLVDGTVLHSFQNRAYRYRVEARADGTASTAFTTVVDRTTNTQAGPITDDFLASPFRARFVRLTVVGAHTTYTGSFVSIRELQILGRVLLPPGYEDWKMEKLSGTPLDGDLDDPNGNGIPNFLEYALGREPVLPAPSPATTLGQTTNAGEVFSTLSFSRPKGLPDVRYFVHVTSNLMGPWDEIEVTSVHVVATDQGIEQVQVRDIIPLSQHEGGRRFMRLVARRIP